jgi:hypothetical protein
MTHAWLCSDYPIQLQCNQVQVRYSNGGCIWCTAYSSRLFTTGGGGTFSPLPKITDTEVHTRVYNKSGNCVGDKKRVAEIGIGIPRFIPV